MAFIYDPNEEPRRIRLGVDLKVFGAQVEFKDGWLELNIDIEDLLKAAPHLHRFYNAEDAVKCMRADELDKMGDLLELEVSRINFKLDSDMKELNRENWERFNKLRDQHRENEKEHNGKMAQLQESYDSSKKAHNNLINSYKELEKNLNSSEALVHQLKHQLETLEDDIRRDYDSQFKHILERERWFAQNGLGTFLDDDDIIDKPLKAD